MAAQVPPLSELNGVTLDMRASALMSQRPHAVAAPYQGFRETIGTYSVLYEVPGSVQDGQAPPGWERLASITASQQLPSTDSTFRHWRAELTRIRTARQSMPRCYGVALASRSDSGAVWSVSGAELFVFAHAIASTDRDTARTWIAFGIAPTADRVRAVFGFAEQHDCAIGIGAPAG